MSSLDGMSLGQLKSAVSTANQRAGQLRSMQSTFTSGAAHFSSVAEGVGRARNNVLGGWNGQAASSASGAMDTMVNYAQSSQQASQNSASAAESLAAQTEVTNAEVQAVPDVDTSWSASAAKHPHNPFSMMADHFDRVDQANQNRNAAAAMANALDDSGRNTTPRFSSGDWPPISGMSAGSPPPRSLPSPTTRGGGGGGGVRTSNYPIDTNTGGPHTNYTGPTNSHIDGPGGRPITQVKTPHGTIPNEHGNVPHTPSGPTGPGGTEPTVPTGPGGTGPTVPTGPGTGPGGPSIPETPTGGPNSGPGNTTPTGGGDVPIDTGPGTGPGGTPAGTNPVGGTEPGVPVTVGSGLPDDVPGGAPGTRGGSNGLRGTTGGPEGDELGRNGLRTGSRTGELSKTDTLTDERLGGRRAGLLGEDPYERFGGMRAGAGALTAEELAGTRGGTMPYGAGARRAQGEDEHEHAVPDYLQETSSIWGGDQTAAPSVIGE